MFWDRAHHVRKSIESMLTIGYIPVTLLVEFHSALYSKYFPSSHLKKLEGNFLICFNGK